MGGGSVLPEEGAEWWCDAYVVADLLGIIWSIELVGAFADDSDPAVWRWFSDLR